MCALFFPFLHSFDFFVQLNSHFATSCGDTSEKHTVVCHCFRLSGVMWCGLWCTSVCTVAARCLLSSPIYIDVWLQRIPLTHQAAPHMAPQGMQFSRRKSHLSGMYDRCNVLPFVRSCVRPKNSRRYISVELNVCFHRRETFSPWLIVFLTPFSEFRMALAKANQALTLYLRFLYSGVQFQYPCLLPQVRPDYLQMRVTVRPQGSITLYGRRELPLMEVRIVASATVEKREDTSMVSCTKGLKPGIRFCCNRLVAR